MTASAAAYYEVRWRQTGTLAWSDPKRFSPSGEIVLTNLSVDTPHDFEVRAVSSCGATSDWVGSDYRTPTVPPPPALPNTVGGVGGPDSILLNWGQGAVRADTQYEIHRAPAIGLYEDNPPDPSDVVWEFVAIVSGTNWTDVVNDTYEYWYRIRPVNYLGGSGPWALIPSSVSATFSSLAEHTTVQLQFTAINAAISQAEADVQALRDTINGDLTDDINKLLTEVFPLMAGSASDLAGNTVTAVGHWSERTERKLQDDLFEQSIDLIGAVTADKKAFILNGDTVQIDADTTLAQELQSLQAVNGATQALINEEKQARIDSDTALAQQIITLQTTIGDGVQAEIDAETLARTTADEALTQTITALSATVDTNAGSAAAAINAEQQARATAVTAVAQSVSTLSTTVAGHTTSISQVVASTNGILARYGVVINAQGRLSGFQLMSGGNVSSFDISADSFSVTPPGGGARIQFSAGNWRAYDSANKLRVQIGTW